MSEPLASPKYRIEVRELGAPDDAPWRTVDSAWTEKQRDRKIKKHAADFTLNVRSLENIVTPAPETPLSKLAPGMSVRDINTDTVLRVTYVYPAGSALAFDWMNDDPAATQKTGTCPIEAIEYFDPIEVWAPVAPETPDFPSAAPEEKAIEPIDPLPVEPEMKAPETPEFFRRPDSKIRRAGKIKPVDVPAPAAVEKKLRPLAAPKKKVRLAAAPEKKPRRKR